MPYWRVGLRYDRLIGHADYGANAAFLATPSFNPQRTSVMFDYTPSESAASACSSRRTGRARA